MNELIVTQWDVNNNTLTLEQEDVKELIVTQWDVNAYEDTSVSARKKGINSYIVGCKLSGNRGRISRTQELIVTQWDVNTSN